MSRIVRVVTQGKGLEVISRDVAVAISGGCRVLVSAARVCDRIPVKPDGDQGAVAEWAEALSQEQGLNWRRVGADVLFARPEAGQGS